MPLANYFVPGGHVLDQHTLISPNGLQMSLSDPAAEQCLSDLPVYQKWCKDPPTTGTKTTSAQYPWITGIHGTTDHDWMDTPGDSSCDICEQVIIPSSTDGSPSRYGDLAPLASDMFKQELYIRGYLKRPTTRPTNAVPRTSFIFGSRSVFPKVLGRRQGRKVAECLQGQVSAAEIPSGLDAHLPEKQLTTPVGCVTLRTPRTHDLESPNASPSDSFDLHEFSYITTFTTPPSSSSFVLDTKTFAIGVDIAASKHAV